MLKAVEQALEPRDARGKIVWPRHEWWAGACSISSDVEPLSGTAAGAGVASRGGRRAAAQVRGARRGAQGVAREGAVGLAGVEGEGRRRGAARRGGARRGAAAGEAGRAA